MFDTIVIIIVILIVVVGIVWALWFENSTGRNIEAKEKELEEAGEEK